MKRTILSFTILCAFAATAAAQTRTPDKVVKGDRPSTQRIGQSGSNGTGEGIKHNMLNGTGDGLATYGQKTYSQQLQEKGLLATKSEGHTEAHHMGPQPAKEGTTSESRNGTAPTGAGAEAHH